MGVGSHFAFPAIVKGFSNHWTSSEISKGHPSRPAINIQEIQDAFESRDQHMETSRSEFRNSSGPAPPPPDWVQWPPPSLGNQRKKGEK